MPKTNYVQERLDILKIDSSTVEELRRLRPILEPTFDEMLESFYGEFLASPSIRILFSDKATIQRAAETQKRHWLDTLLAGKFDNAYVEKARTIGRANARAGLSPSTYIAGYSSILDKFRECIVRELAGDPSRLARSMNAIQKAVFLDMDLVIGCYSDTKDQVMRNLLQRTTQFSDEIDLLTKDLLASSTSLIAAAESANGNAGTVIKEAHAVLEQTNALRERLSLIGTRDHLYVLNDNHDTGTFSRLRTLVFGKQAA